MNLSGMRTKEKSRRGGLRHRGKNVARNKAIAAAARSGKTTKEIAAQFSLTGAMILIILRKAGVPAPGRKMGPMFPCGHPRWGANRLMNYGVARCLECHRAAARRWHQPKNPRLPQYPGRSCALAKVW